MDLTSRQRLLAFALTVLVLAGLGIFLFVTGTADHHTASPPAHHSTAPATPPTTTVPPATTPPPTGAAAASSPVNIYNWLPFSKQQLSRAAAVVTRFSAYYGTYSYSESATSYVSRMQGLATSQLAGQIGSGYAAPGLTDQRKQQKQVSSGSAQIDSLRAFGASSITFVVTITQQITATSGTSHQVNQYAVTATENGGTWQASNIQLASVGNQ